MRKLKAAGIILAAGQGKRMNSTISNKVTLNLGDKPMVKKTVEVLRKAGIKPIVIVVGFQKESVTNLFKNQKDIIFAEQHDRLGTAHAAQEGMRMLPKNVKDFFVVNGDDSAFYKPDIFDKLFSEHKKNKNAITFLTLRVKNPFGLGRIIRSRLGKVVAIFEEKDASEKQRRIKEINPGCYLFNIDFFRKNISKTPKSSVTGEFYIVSLIPLALKDGKKVEGIDAGHIPWRGVNTNEELEEATKIFLEFQKSES
ncbi:MAG: hypothetical protein A2798_02120 [Candidatus Levybacteria bacterium RIFCSPHIGHO2_01_FULL_37_17]|nr:MAG: hypothetical protein A2798_02120 [Candidatus Levybacteria bacterium RIFCSPHIGHO2_01_FULL_37_17]OGH36675.1 MAG: hypothetical protein A2959_00110 [Candidatus Levybacteria bacterium RIFCSPLOWO2_01_FULL_38_23]